MDHNHKDILVIHPADTSTDFLSIIYSNMNATVIRQSIPKSRLKELMKKADRIIMLGHGTESGMGFVKYDGSGYPIYITTLIDSSLVYLLREKKDNVFIWCNADKFVEKYKLSGFSTGMFISETNEAYIFDVKATEKEVYESNLRFATVVRNHISKNGENLKNLIKEDYDLESDVAKYNHSRLYNFTN